MNALLNVLAEIGTEIGTEKVQWADRQAGDWCVAYLGTDGIIQIDATEEGSAFTMKGLYDKGLVTKTRQEAAIVLATIRDEHCEAAGIVMPWIDADAEREAYTYMGEQFTASVKWDDRKETDWIVLGLGLKADVVQATNTYNLNNDIYYTQGLVKATKEEAIKLQEALIAASSSRLIVC